MCGNEPALGNFVFLLRACARKRPKAGHRQAEPPTGCPNRYAAGMTLALTLLQTEVTRELPIPAWAFGVLGFGLLLILLLITWSIGKGRPHS